MKTRFWVAIFAVVFVLCGTLTLFFFTKNEPAEAVRITSDGVVLYELPLSVDRELTVETSYGTNTVTIRDGKVAVTAASCPDHYCMKRGFCDGGTQIVCLPNRLVLSFTGSAEVDGVVG